MDNEPTMREVGGAGGFYESRFIKIEGLGWTARWNLAWTLIFDGKLELEVRAHIKPPFEEVAFAPVPRNRK
jgi:hypothetical protein